MQRADGLFPVSYTHLDVYKRQSIGFVHRGLEKLVEKKEFTEYVYVAERICGICSFMHGMGYCEAVEHIMNIEIPPRARYLRTIWCEMSRIHSHLLWLGLLADAFGFESLFMQSWRIREKVLDMFEMCIRDRIMERSVGKVRKKLPIGIENFEEFSVEDFYYVDKTLFIKELLQNWGKANPVSYTQLTYRDMKKRVPEEKRQRRKNPMEGNTIQPVSYTHLDVYKRQAWL